MSSEWAHFGGGAAVFKRFKIRANVGTAVFTGIPVIMVTDGIGVGPATATNAANTAGLALDRGVYSATQGDAEGMVTVSVRPDLICRALISGAATEGTALTLLTNSSASAGGTVVTDTTNVPAGVSYAGIYMWCVSGANVGNSRVIASQIASTSFTVTVPFPNAIAVNDTFLFAPFNPIGDGTGSLAGNTACTFTTNLTQVRQNVAPGAAGAANIQVYDVDMQGRTDTFLQFVLIDHIYNVDTV